MRKLKHIVVERLQSHTARKQQRWDSKRLPLKLPFVITGLHILNFAFLVYETDNNTNIT